ncbi:dimethylsulfonioproprionate lyase family protein [Curvivirga aplysinae]|uniref:dimethylsulfonioproprionate lyase family protein n=1 Tax=Curvivirga aplysinae TaxID=2529852 RepID=UPI001C3FD862|nr:dimethylsulfonioproprionate lyase family protein [Curvivirga aplysinae]
MSFQKAVIDLYSNARPQHQELDIHFANYLEGLKTEGQLVESYKQQSHDLQTMFGEFLRKETLPQHNALKAALLELENKIRWYDFSDLDKRFPDYSNHITFAQILGPVGGFGDAMHEHPSINAGIFIQAPGYYYAPHFHDSVELYHVLHGTAYWKRGDEDWMPRKPGEFILHDREQVHAMRTGDDPIIALWAWYGGPNAPVLFTETDFHGNPQ